MKKMLLISLLFGLVLLLDAKLQTRKTYFGDRIGRHSGRPLGYQIYRGGNPEGEVNRLRMQVIDKYDRGEYVAGMQGWQDDEREAMDIQTRLGYTVPERYTWGN